MLPDVQDGFRVLWDVGGCAVVLGTCVAGLGCVTCVHGDTRTLACSLAGWLARLGRVCVWGWGVGGGGGWRSKGEEIIERVSAVID